MSVPFCFVSEGAIYIHANTVAMTQPGRLKKYVSSAEQIFPTRPALAAFKLLPFAISQMWRISQTSCQGADFRQAGVAVSFFYDLGVCADAKS